MPSRDQRFVSFRAGYQRYRQSLEPPPKILMKFLKHNLSLQLRLNRALDRSGLGGAGPTALDLAVLADEELLKVPLDALQTHEAGLLLLHPLVDRLGLVAVDFGLAEDLVGDLVADDAEVLDLFVGAGVLTAELVAGEGEDLEVVGVGGFDVWKVLDWLCLYHIWK